MALGPGRPEEQMLAGEVGLSQSSSVAECTAEGAWVQPGAREAAVQSAGTESLLCVPS